ncbi:TetR/AcrR family transcriptional regulator [Sinirhodobacter populi]|uniref:TetR/AcrR family transcriptional regulator n=1 Tax=Paenirhodobacter populi TaxID=2306993 RepID=A0A443K1A9_9RHOB|nr:TetR family transcriptional regulator [Sinirhodobacter populi]RWR26538.1 TetR/AcrR family transcriptional regulator [Sinirhodobacter populi]
MAERSTPRISSRKRPKQARSTELVSAILEAAVQVLEEEGAQRFTTARVAEKAGVSVGSLYQYFPNKAAILFRLQSDEWRQTTSMMQSILEDQDQPPLDRLRALVHGFIRSECEEAAVRIALNDAAPLYRDAEEARQERASIDSTFNTFIARLLPTAGEETCALVSDLVLTTLSTVGKEFSGKPRSSMEIETYAGAVADMFCAYLTSASFGPIATRSGISSPNRASDCGWNL